MANITRYDPFSDMVDNLFKGFVLSPIRMEGMPQPEIKMDVTENGKAYTVRAEIPGVNKDDIKVSVNGNEVSISAEVKKETEKKEGEKVVHSERYYGKVFRSFTLGQDVDETSAVAKYSDGVLELTLPKKTGSAARQITIM